MAGYRAGRMSEDIRRIISGKMRDLKDPRIHGGDMLTIVAATWQATVHSARCMCQALRDMIRQKRQ